MEPAEKQKRKSIRPVLTGALGLLGLQCLLAGALLRFVPGTSVIAPLARILDNIAPWLLGLALLISALLLALRSPRLGAVLALASLALGGHLYVQHRALSLPLVTDRAPDLRILFFNALSSNTASADRIAGAVLAQDPDIVVLAEREAVASSLHRLGAAYAFVSPCEDGACEILVASKIKPKRFWQLQLNPAWDERYAVAEFAAGDGQSFFLAASQIAKPWLSGISEPEFEKLAAQYNWFDGPVVAVGDFNAAPWSLPMRRLLNRTGMRGLRAPPATWPVRAGGLGLPIDQILMRGGPRVTGIRPFGGDLGSNHRGFVAHIALTPDG